MDDDGKLISLSEMVIPLIQTNTQRPLLEQQKSYIGVTIKKPEVQKWTHLPDIAQKQPEQKDS